MPNDQNQVNDQSVSDVPAADDVSNTKTNPLEPEMGQDSQPVTAPVQDWQAQPQATFTPVLEEEEASRAETEPQPVAGQDLAEKTPQMEETPGVKEANIEIPEESVITEPDSENTQESESQDKNESEQEMAPSNIDEIKPTDDVEVESETDVESALADAVSARDEVAETKKRAEAEIEEATQTAKEKASHVVGIIDQAVKDAEAVIDAKEEELKAYTEEKQTEIEGIRERVRKLKRKKSEMRNYLGLEEEKKHKK